MKPGKPRRKGPKRVEIIYKPVGDEPYVTELFEAARRKDPAKFVEGDELTASQILVGGCIDMVWIGGRTNIVVNDDGLLEGLPENCCGYVGDIFFVNIESQHGTMQSLTQNDKRRVFKWFEEFRAERPPEQAGFRVVALTPEQWMEHRRQRRLAAEATNRAWKKL